jgi:antitoxin component YwqK of YwqJK toxin-antitoxin module
MKVFKHKESGKSYTIEIIKNPWPFLDGQTRLGVYAYPYFHVGEKIFFKSHLDSERDQYIKDNFEEVYVWVELIMETEIKKGYYKNGNLYYEGSYVNGIRHGPQKTCYKNGKIWILYYAKNGLLHGMRMNFNIDTTRGYVLQYGNGQDHGPRIQFRYEGE